MATKELENLSLKELLIVKQRREKSRKNILIGWSIFFVLAVFTVIWRLQQGTNFSSLAPLIALLLLARVTMTYPINKKIKQVELEIQNRN